MTAFAEVSLDRQGAEHLAAFEARAVADAGRHLNLDGIAGGAAGTSWSWGANATECWITENMGATSLHIYNKTTGATVSLTDTTAGYWKAFLVASA